MLPIQPTPTIQLAPCDAGGRRYLVHLAEVSSIQQSNVVTTFPTLDKPIGRVDVQRASIPIVSLAQRLGGEPAEATQRQYCLIVGQGASRWGLLVDRVHRTRDANQSDVAPLPHEMRCAWCPGALLVSDETPEHLDSASREKSLRPMLVLNPAGLRPGSSLDMTASRPVEHERFTGGSRGTGIAPSSRQVLLFASGAADSSGTRLRFGFPAAQIQQILQRPELTRVPLAREPFVGLTAWRNTVVPVIDLDLAIGRDPDETDRRTRLVIARRPHTRDPIGFLATSNVRSLRLTDDALRLPPRDHNLIATFGTFEIEGTRFTLPNLDAALSPVVPTAAPEAPTRERTFSVACAGGQG